MVMTGHQLNDVLRQAHLRNRCPHHFGEGVIRIPGGCGSAKQGNVAALETQGRGINRDVRAGFVDHRHHAHRNAHLFDPQSVRKRVVANPFTDRIRDADDVTDAVRDISQTTCGQREAIDDARVGAVCARGLHVHRVCIKDLRLMCVQRIGDRMQRAILRVGVSDRQSRHDRPGTRADVDHRRHFSPSASTRDRHDE